MVSMRCKNEMKGENEIQILAINRIVPSVKVYGEAAVMKQINYE